VRTPSWNIASMLKKTVDSRLMKLSIKILYLGNSSDGSATVDRRRFLAFAAMNPHLQVFFKPEPGLKFDVLIYSIGGDLPLALSLAAEVKQVVVDYSNHYLVEKSWFKSVFRNQFFTLRKGHKLAFSAYRSSLKRIIRLADLVIFPSVSQKSELMKLNSRVARLTDFFGSEVNVSDGPVEGERSIFWEGQGVNVPTLQALSRPLQRVKYSSFNVVTDEYFGRAPFRRRSEIFLSQRFSQFAFYSWSQTAIASLAAKSRVGVIPLNLEDQFIAAKPENKLVLMWLLGLPVLCSPTESYSLLAAETGLDFLCKSEEEWCAKLDQYLGDGRTRAAEAAFLLNYASQNYDDSAQFNKWIAVFEEYNIL
jgi:hypothetical protein